jgi:phage shock protein A
MQAKATQIKAKAVSAKTRKQAADIKADMNGSGFSTFARMQEKVDRQLAEAEAFEDLNSTLTSEADNEKALAAKYNTGVAGTDASLAALKAEMGMTDTTTADDALEALKAEMAQK